MQPTHTVPPEPRRFLETEPFHYARMYAARHGCDLAVPGSIGIGSLVCYTRLVEAMALDRGRRLRLLTSPLSYSWFGAVEGEAPYPIWENNPYIGEIVDGLAIDTAMMAEIASEMDNFCQTRHEIENICAPYGLRPRRVVGQLFLSEREMAWALDTLAELPRPVVCLCPYGRSSPLESSPWYLEKWERMIAAMGGRVGFLQVGNNHLEQKPLAVFTPRTKIREMIALIWASDMFVGFDTGPGHIAAALEKPAAILWDAVHKTPLEEAKQPGFSLATMLRWAYPQNRNLMILGEREDEVLHECLDFIEDTAASFGTRRRPL